MRIAKTIAGGLALGTALLLVSPDESRGFSLLGHSLGQSQRDFRVFNNFTAPGANNNTLAETNFPTYDGAVMAIWKGCVEWGSGPHADGSSGDTQSNIGDGGADFDPSFQGLDNDNGGSFGNTHAQINSDNPGVFAFQSGGSGGWRIRYHQNWNWADGPGPILGNEADLQGIGCHEYGHALGLGHSASGSATMANGTGTGIIGTRSINADDSAGIQAIYGVKSGSKPEITALAYDTGTNEVLITGFNFNASGNEVWFTQGGIGGNGTPIKATNVSSTSGGTQIDLFLPAQAGSGDVLVRTGGGGSGLSNAWPIETDPFVPTAPIITSVSPPELQALWPTNEQEVTLNGTGFFGVSSITVDGVPVPTFPLEFTVVNDNQITLNLPLLSQLGQLELELVSTLGTNSIFVDVVAPPDPVLRLGSGMQPEAMNSLAPHILRMGGHPGNVTFLWVSGSDIPTPVPGLFNLDIGNFATNLFYMGAFTIEPKGWVEAAYQFNGLPFFTPIYWQGVEYDVVSPTFPVPATNIAEGFWTF